MNYGWWVWLALALHAFVWPHVAWRWARGSVNSVRAECRNLLVDHFLTGIWFAAMAFALVPTALIFTFLGMDSMIAAGRKQFQRGCISTLAGIALGLLLFGLQWQPNSSALQVAASLPLLILHPISVGHILFRALSQLKRQREELAHLSQHDGLTGLFNRRHWEALVKTEFARFRRTGQVSTLVLIDLDHFKAINDAYGHATGDTVLRNFAERLRAALRSIDMPGRYGGEEFGILLPNTAPKEAGELMRRLQANIRKQPLYEKLPVTASFGLAGLTPDVPNHEAWMRLCDQMLYRAKDRGRDCVVTAGDSRPLPLATEAREPGLRNDMPVIARVLSGLSLGHIAAALFDPSDRLVWANDIFLQLYAVKPESRSFCDIIESCYERKLGPRITTDDLPGWIEAADTKRRSMPQRCFAIDTMDGRYFRVDEVSFHDGWLLDWWTEVTLEQALLLSPNLSNLSDGTKHTGGDTDGNADRNDDSDLGRAARYRTSFSRPLELAPISTMADLAAIAAMAAVTEPTDTAGLDDANTPPTPTAKPPTETLKPPAATPAPARPAPVAAKLPDAPAPAGQMKPHRAT
jgi:diguanylate cyclase (GGDEF)-like protein